MWAIFLFFLPFFSSCLHKSFLPKKTASVEELIFNKKYKEGLALAKNTDLESLAWTLGKVNHYLEAKDAYEKINHESADKETKAKACFFTGFLLYEKGLYPMALFSWRKCKNDMLNTAHYENYLWYESLLAILEENYVVAKRHIINLKDNFKESLEWEKYLYFHAYVLNKLNKKEKAFSLWQTLREKKVSYYSLLSKKDFKTDLPVFPKPHFELISESAKKWQVLPSLIYAIMKAESGFNKNAKSKRGALGLMQIMPDVGSILSLNIKDKNFLTADLSDEKKSINLAALLLALLKQQFGHYHLAIAAYNAGADKVQAWQNLFGHLPIELFIERVPFKETRNYIKSVLVNESIYHASDGNKLRLLI